MKMNVFWDVVQCRLVEIEAVSAYETSVNFYEPTPRNVPEDSHFQS
jgi:hypothetical protein